MTLDEFRLGMESYRRAVDAEAKSQKDSYLVQERLRALYQKFDDAERAMAAQVLSEWVLSADETVRFDALHLVDAFNVSATAPSLTKLAERLASSSDPGAPYELRKVIRIMERLPA